MKTPEQLAATAFNHQNWTKLTLEELIMCGRILRSDEQTLMDFVNAANGHAENLEAFRNYKKAVQLIKTLWDASCGWFCCRLALSLSLPLHSPGSLWNSSQSQSAFSWWCLALPVNSKPKTNFPHGLYCGEFFCAWNSQFYANSYYCPEPDRLEPSVSKPTVYQWDFPRK